MRYLATAVIAGGLALVTLAAQGPGQPDWARIDEETMRHFQALLRFDTADPPGNEKPAADYLQQTLQQAGIPVETFVLEPNRVNVVARLEGSGRSRPLLLMAHTDVVNVDASKWTHPPFSATREGGYVYGRGSVDDKDNVAASLMVMLLLKRLNVPLDRDVIFLAEAGEEGNTRVGIQFMVNRHFPSIDAEYCLAEGGNVMRQGGQVRYATVTTVEKIPRSVELTARGISGHGSIPLQTNAIVHLGAALARIADWQPPIRLNETSRAHFQRLAEISPPEDAARYRDVLDPAKAPAVERWFRANDPAKAAMLHVTASPNIIQGGYRLNVIPSDAKATLDVRTLPDDDPAQVLEMIRTVVNDPSITVAYAQRDVRPAGSSRLDTVAFRAIESAVTTHYKTTTVPTLMNGATDSAYLRGKGVQCYGMGPAIDAEDGPKGFGSHSDQERILESELHRFVRFTWDIVNELARAR
jgi:acetylornithine deacetylase/succinyl-diaminopimelate desuccinylase-like protein